VAECLSIPKNSPETARDLAARHNQAFLPKSLKPRDARPARSRETAHDFGRATRLGLLLPIPVAPRVAARAVEQSALANDPHPLSYQHFSGLAIDRRHPEDVPFGGQAIVTAGSCA